jgi:hypothetical protein
MIYDDIDMRNSYNHGFWHGAVSGVLGMFLLCLGIGLFLYT